MIPELSALAAGAIALVLLSTHAVFIAENVGKKAEDMAIGFALMLISIHVSNIYTIDVAVVIVTVGIIVMSAFALQVRNIASTSR